MKKILIVVAASVLLAAPAAAQKKRGKGTGVWAKTPGLYVRFATTMGDFVCRLLEKEAPETVANFVGLAVGEKEFTDPKDGEAKKARFYDGLNLHRVVPDYIIQGGDPKGDSTGGPGYEFEDEINGLKFDRPGRLAMANSGPDSNGSQFFVTVVPVEQLNDQTGADGAVKSHYTIFGQVVDGQKVVDEISRVKAEAERPVAPVVMKKVEVLRVDKKGRASPVAAPAAPKGMVTKAAAEDEPAQAEPAPKKARKKRGKKKSVPKSEAAPKTEEPPPAAKAPVQKLPGMQEAPADSPK